MGFVNGTLSTIGLIVTRANVSGINKTHVGLSNCGNISDLAKPISTATQSALDLKLNASTCYVHLPQLQVLTCQLNHIYHVCKMIE